MSVVGLFVASYEQKSQAKKKSGGLRLRSRCSLLELRIWWTADPPKAFPTSSGSALLRLAAPVTGRLLPSFFIDASTFASASISRDRVSLSSYPCGTTYSWQSSVRVTVQYHLDIIRFLLPFSAFRRVGLPARDFFERGIKATPELDFCQTPKNAI